MDPPKSKTRAARPKKPPSAPPGRADGGASAGRGAGEEADDSQALRQALAEALEQQTASGAILNVISRSATELQPALNSIVETAARLCAADGASIWISADGQLRSTATYSVDRKFAKFLRQNPAKLDRGTVAGRTVIERQTIHLPDVLEDPDYDWPTAQTVGGYRSLLGVPLLRAEETIGVISLFRKRVEPFTDKQIELVATFADQAVIAIANVRLFDEVEARNRELTEALEQQTATSEILHIISSSPRDLEPVFAAIAKSAARLCEGTFCFATRYDGELIHMAAHHNMGPAALEKVRKAYPHLADRDTLTGLAILDRRMVHVQDVEEDINIPSRGREMSRSFGFKCVVAVPMLRDGKAIGAITVARDEAKPFSEGQIELLKTFADQAVIAIENARLFDEVQAQSRKVEEQAAQLAEWNRTLESRVAEQVAELTRLSKLTRFHSPKISDLIMSGEADDPLKTRRSEVTVVYADLRGFTGFTEIADPEEVMAVLREYHAELGRAIVAYDGTIEHFAGDGAMVLFNAPVPVDDHEMHAIRMTIQMRKSLAALSSEWRKRGYELGFGAGIASGYATLGTIGFEERLDYGAIGTVCNLAARLCGEAEDGQILISPRVFAKLEDRVEATPVGALTLKGFHRPVSAHNVLNLSAEPPA